MNSTRDIVSRYHGRILARYKSSTNQNCPQDPPDAAVSLQTAIRPTDSLFPPLLNLKTANMALPNPTIGVSFLDEWKGVIDPDLRRRLQNRLNQRAHRQRRRAAKAQSRAAASESESLSPTSSGSGSGSGGGNGQSDAIVKQSPQYLPPTLDSFTILGPQAKNSKTRLRQLEAWLQSELASGSPRIDLLLGVKRVNFLRALYANIEVLGYTATEMHDDALSQFGTAGPKRSVYREQTLLPLALQQSSTQLNTPHHPWLDLLPIPQMRDNLILAGDAYDDGLLCKHMSGHAVPSASVPDKRLGDAQGETGVLIWRDPWDPSGWEVTETFLRNWGWVVRDCWGLFRSTNRWRAVRGEPPLFRVAFGLMEE
ncbi:hypothetical protein BJY04DRAFT_221278 [Aspergillus karnatakaensis]|uniref:DUF3425 domain-containing protein n=1 Tax=Aspergillus karnatakaensis TaxID=1810916 RepID=UPI003CCD3B7F